MTVGLATAALLLAACGNTGDSTDNEILVSAASSLTEAFTGLGNLLPSAPTN